jgi:hypothetical protein
MPSPDKETPLTKREYVACRLLVAIVSNPERYKYDATMAIDRAVEMADALIARLEKEPPGA